MSEMAALTDDLDSILAQTLRQIQESLSCDACSVNLLTADGHALQCRAVIGEGARWFLGLDMPVEQGINGWIARERQPVLIADADLDPRRLHINGRTDPIRAVVGAPLVAAGQTVGTIYASARQPGMFTQEHLDFLVSTANRIAPVVQRVWLLEQACRRAEEMESLLSIGAVLAASLDVDQILQTIYEQASRIMDTSAFFVALYDPQRGELEFRLVYDRGERLEPFVQSLNESEGLADHVARTGESFLIHHLDREQDTLPIPPVVLGAPTQSWIGVPIKFADQVLGVISSQSYEPYAFTVRHLRLLSAIANQAGIGLQNAGLVAGLQRAQQEIMAERDKLVHLHQVVASVQRAEDVPSRLQRIADGLQALGWGRVAVFLWDADMDVAALAHAGYEPEDEGALWNSWLPCRRGRICFGTGMARFRIGSCYYLPWCDPWVRAHVPRPETAGAGVEGVECTDDLWYPLDRLYVPLLGRQEEMIGVIALNDPVDRRRPTAEALRIIELFAQEAALAIENAQLVADLQLINTDLQELVDTQAHLLNTIEEMVAVLDTEEGIDRPNLAE